MIKYNPKQVTKWLEELYYFGGFDLLVGEELFDDDHWEEGDSVFEDVCWSG